MLKDVGVCGAFEDKRAELEYPILHSNSLNRNRHSAVRRLLSVRQRPMLQEYKASSWSLYYRELFFSW